MSNESGDELGGTVPSSLPLTRRNLLRAGGAGTGALLLGAGLAAPAATAAPPAPVNMREDGTYEMQPLKKPAWQLAVCQTRIRGVDAKNPAAGRKENLQRMLDAVDAAQDDLSGPKDWLLFHEFPITGFNHHWDRADALRAAIEIPGEETEALSKKARQYGCYITFGSYAREREWSNHLLSLTTTIDPAGAIVAKHWKARNIKGIWPNFELITSTVFDNLDRFVEMYGWDQVVPVLRTPLGNITTTSVQREPEFPRAAAMKGCEVLLRTASGGFSAADAEVSALYNGIWSACANNAVSPGNPGYFEGGGAGGSVIYGPAGEKLAEATDANEQSVVATVQIEQYRKRHRQPIAHMELYKPVFDRYSGKYPTGLFTQSLPPTPQEAARYLADKARWK